MAWEHLQKPEKKTQRCCYCCIEAFSGFLLLMLVATVVTLLRYFLEFSGPSFTFAGNTTELFINATATHTPLRNVLLAGFPLQTSVMNKTVSEQSLERTSPQTSPSWNRDPPRWPGGKPSPWSPSPPLISAAEGVSPRRLPFATNPRSPQLTLPINWMSPQHQTLAMEETSLPLWSSTAKLLPPYLLSSAGKPVLPQYLPSAVEPTSSHPLNPTVEQMSSPQLSLATKWALPPHLTEDIQPKSQPQATTANVAFSPWLATSAKPRSSQLTPAILSSPPQLTQAISLASPQTRTTAVRRTSSHPASAIRLSFSLQRTTAIQRTSPSQGTSAIKSRFLPQLTTAMRWAPSSQTTSAIKSGMLPQGPTDSKQTPFSQLTSTIKSRFLPQLTTAMKWTSSNQPTSAIKLGRLSQRPTAMRWAPSSQTTPAIKSRFLPQLSTGINPATAKTSSLQSLPEASPWLITLPPNVTYSQHPIWGHNISGSRGGNYSHQDIKGSFQPVNEVYHSSYSNGTSISGMGP